MKPLWPFDGLQMGIRRQGSWYPCRCNAPGHLISLILLDMPVCTTAPSAPWLQSNGQWHHHSYFLSGTLGTESWSWVPERPATPLLHCVERRQKKKLWMTEHGRCSRNLIQFSFFISLFFQLSVDNWGGNQGESRRLISFSNSVFDAGKNGTKAPFVATILLHFLCKVQ